MDFFDISVIFNPIWLGLGISGVLIRSLVTQEGMPRRGSHTNT